LAAVLIGLYLVSGQRGYSSSTLVFLGLLGALGYRWMRNRRRKLLKAFVTKAAKLPEVRVVVFRDNCATVIVEKAQAKIYMRLNALMDAINRKLFIGIHMTVAVRDSVPPDELRAYLEGPGILYVRDDVIQQNLENADRRD
jgi:hypothetical protein